MPAAGHGQVQLEVTCLRGTTSGIRYSLLTGAAFAAAAALIALATTNTRDDPNQAHAAEPHADSPLAAAAPEPINEEI